MYIYICFIYICIHRTNFVRTVSKFPNNYYFNLFYIFIIYYFNYCNIKYSDNCNIKIFLQYLGNNTRNNSSTVISSYNSNILINTKVCFQNETRLSNNNPNTEPSIPTNATRG